MLLAVLAVLSAGLGGVDASFSATTASTGSVTAAATFTRCYDDAVTASSPLSYWRLDETSGTAAADQVGSRPGTYTGGYTLGQAAAQRSTGTSTTFNGSTGYLDVPYAAALNPAAPLTVEAWVYPTGGTGTTRTVASSWKNNAGTRAGYWLGINSSDQWQFSDANNTNAQVNATGSVAVLNTWTHLVGTLSGTTLSLYVNGILQGTATGSYTAAPSATALEIGAEYDAGTRSAFLTGSIDEVAVYGSALAAATIASHYNTGRCYADEVFKDSPAGYWRMNDASGTTMKDFSDNANFGVYPTTVGSPTLAVAGALNNSSDKAVSFSGSQLAYVPYTSQLNPAQFSLEAWVKPTNGGYRRTVASSWYDEGVGVNSRGYWLGAGTDNKWDFDIANTSGTVISAKAPTATTTYGVWYHLVATYDGTTARLYVNGLMVASAATTIRFPTSTGFAISADWTNGAWNDGIAASIDEVAVYATALTSTRIQAHYLMGRSYQDTVTDSSPNVYWRLGESSGATANDTAGSNTGTYSGSPSQGQPGAIAGDAGTSVTFNGTSQYVSRANTAALNPAAPFSLEFWINVASSGQGTYRTAVSSWYGSGSAEYGYCLCVQTDNTWRWQLGSATTSGAYKEVVGPAAVANSWTHIVGTYDGTTALLYVNGVVTGPGVTASFGRDTVRPFTVAADQESGSPGGYLAGRFDDVAVYNRALPAAEVQLHYDSGHQ